MNSLNEINKSHNIQMSQEDYKNVNARLYLLMLLSTLQGNLIQEVEQIYKSKGKFKMQIKHTHNRIKSLINENMNNSVFNNFSSEQTDDFMEDCDVLEKSIKDWAKIK